MAVRPEHHQKKVTYEEYSRLPDDDGLRYELVDGELYVTPAPNARHQEILGRLFVCIATHLEKQRAGKVFFAPFEVDFFDHDAVQPDLIFVSDADSDIITEAKIVGVPSLVVEVLSNSSRDRRIKRNLYERYGVPEYWILDPLADQAEVYQLTAQGYADPRILKPGEELTTQLIPGLGIDLRELFKP